MKIRSAFFIAVWALSVIANAQTSLPTSQSIRIRLKKISAVSPSVSISGMGLTVQGQSLSARREMLSIGFGAVRVERRAGIWLVIDRHDQQIRWSQRSECLEVTGTGLRVDLRPMSSAIELCTSRGRGIDLIAKLDIEEYLMGVLPSEMSAGWPIEALKSQAVVSRTYALAKMEERKGQKFDVEVTTMDQVFRWEHLEKENSTVRLAVQSTRGEILMTPEQGLISTYFHADCGGQTEFASRVWGHSNFDRAILPVGCPLKAGTSWRLEIKEAELLQRLKFFGSVATLDSSQIQTLVSVNATEVTDAGRWTRLGFKFSNGLTKTITGQELRQALGFDRLKSTRFKMVQREGVFSFTGSGYGHGVGMCQVGARQLALQGEDYRHILRFYFPKMIFVDRWTNQLTGKNSEREEQNRSDYKPAADAIPVKDHFDSSKTKDAKAAPLSQSRPS